MRTARFLLTIGCFVATPAFAADGSGYAGIEGGILAPRDLTGDIAVTYPSGGTPAGLVSYNDGVRLKARTGYDIDAIAGYDFGMFRVEAEIGYKHARLDGIRLSSQLLTDLSSVSETAPALTSGEIDLVNPRTTALSGMINGLLDFGRNSSIAGYAGAGIGEAHVKRLTDSDSAFAWQLIAGLRAPISPNIEAGLKYRYFNTGRLGFRGDFDFGSAGEFPYTTSAKFRSHSLLASLIFNFSGRAAPPPPPPAPPPPPPPEAPAMQTCADGSMVPATTVCPAPPPPPPPPTPPPAERGR